MFSHSRPAAMSTDDHDDDGGDGCGGRDSSQRRPGGDDGLRDIPFRDEDTDRPRDIPVRVRDRDAEAKKFHRLVQAAQGGQLSTVRKLLESGCDVQRCDGLGLSALTYAAMANQWDCFLELSRARCHTDLRTSGTQVDRLVSAIYKGASDQVIKLAGRRKFIRGLTEVERSALLFLAITQECYPDAVQALVDKRSINTRYHLDMTPLMVAVITGNHRTLETLLLFDPDVYACDGYLNKPAFCYAIEKGCSQCLELLLESPTKRQVNTRDFGRMTTLAVARDQSECLLVLLNSNKSESIDRENMSDLLCEAAKSGSVNCLDLLLDHGFDPSLSTEEGVTPLMFAVIKDRPECFSRLLQRGVPIDAVDCEGNSALMHAAQWRRPHFLSTLLQHGADVNLANGSFMTAVSMASCHNDLDALEILLTSLPASTHLRVEAHSMAFKLAAKFCNVNTLNTLMGHGVFRWKWMGDNAEASPELIAQAAVRSGTRPGHFSKFDETMTILKLAFWLDCPGTVRFLMANMYLSSSDVKLLPRDTNFIRMIRNRRGNPELRALLDQLVCEPWSLQALSFLAVSSALEAASSRHLKGLLSEHENVPLSERIIETAPSKHVNAPSCGIIVDSPPSKHVNAPSCGIIVDSPPSKHVNAPSCGIIVDSPPSKHVNAPSSGIIADSPPSKHVNAPSSGILADSPPSKHVNAPSCGILVDSPPSKHVNAPSSGILADSPPSKHVNAPSSGILADSPPSKHVNAPSSEIIADSPPSKHVNASSSGFIADSPSSGHVNTHSSGFIADSPSSGHVNTRSSGFIADSPSSGHVNTRSSGFIADSPSSGHVNALPMARFKAMIQRLPIPPKFIDRLLFQTPLSRVCVDNWSAIGLPISKGDSPPVQVNLMSNKAPIWKGDSVPDPECATGRCSHNDKGFRDRYTLICQNSRRLELFLPAQNARITD